jgi:hypothetical protein
MDILCGNNDMKLNEITAPALTPDQVKWLKKMDISEYSVDEGFVNVYGNVDISNKKLTSIPVKFGYVGGDFYCYRNKLTSLQGAPREVGGDFSCSHNDLSSLQESPEEVGGNFYCDNNKFKAEPDHSFIKIDGEFEWK